MTPFKKKDWHFEITKHKLSEMLINHYHSFGLSQNGWTEEDIWFFLMVNHWIYHEPHAQNHHFRTCEELIVGTSS